MTKDTPPTIPDFIKAQMQRLIDNLELDTSILIQVIGSIREIFNEIKDDLPSPLKEIIQPVAFLEVNVPKFFNAQSTLAAQEAQKKLSYCRRPMYPRNPVSHEDSQSAQRVSC
jgi:hypothetical protein